MLRTNGIDSVTHSAKNGRSKAVHSEVPANQQTPVSDASDEFHQELHDLRGQLAAFSKSQAVIEFGLDGTIIAANDNFLTALGYRLDEIKGRHHSMFVEPAFAASAEYKQFWSDIGSGQFLAAEYKRLGKGGREIWIQASYNPVLDQNGSPVKVIKLATDITATKQRSADIQGKMAAISKAQAIIEFNLDGTIISANENFLSVMGYRLDEIVGRHHRTFVDPAYAESPEYSRFWSDLAAGKFQTAEYKRLAKGGKEVWIQASYNPILDMNGRPFKVVKFATDVTADKRRTSDYEGQIAAISKSQAVIEFDLEGNVLTANENFLAVTGYRLDEIKGQHHRTFVEPEDAVSREYQEFWAQLRSGKFQAAEYKRRGKGGKEIWIQASYNPIFDLNGKPFKVVKYATDITVRKAVEKEMATMSITLAAASEELTTVAKQLVSNSETTSSQANSVSAAAEQVSRNVQSVATGSEEMGASIREIAKNSSEAARVASQAVKFTSNINAMVAKLGESSTQIGQVIKVITAIAQQTNLLALNATIEAARAGEAGKGFAVVANEVKELAKATAKATEEISQKIQTIQGDSHAAVAAIGEIGGIIEKINDIQNAIATAVEEQTATTNEIGRNVSEAADGAGEIAKSIGGVADAAKNTSRGASDTESSAIDLAGMASQLRILVGKFQK